MSSPGGSDKATLRVTCEDVEATLDALAGTGPPVEPGEPLDGGQIGRYRLLECVGRGSMGTVHAAYDPELDRKIAIKLLRDVPRLAGSLAEARALARLAHPNVVTVFDVGTAPRGTFIAMEFVAGRTLRQWLNDARRSPDEILAAFRDAGRGLAAAHVAGVVHRDFKPENVLVGDDGRVRVGDFGLARALVSEPSSDDATHAGATTATRQAGTPAYMAPELFMGEAADARSDAFAFCVALWEALFGARPFSGRTVPELVSAVLEVVPEPPADVPVPAHVVAALRRGLAVDPRDRFVDMPALLAAIAPRPRRGVTRMAGAAAGLAMIGVVVAARWPRAPACDTGWPAWTPERSHAIASALEGLDVVDADALARPMIADLDAFAAAHAAARAELCAMQERGDAGVLAVEACLLHMRQHGEAVLDVLAEPDAQLLLASADLRDGLGDPSHCLDPDDVARVQASTFDPRVAARVEPLRARLEHARVQELAGHFAAAAVVVDEVVGEATQLGDRRLIGEAMLVRGNVLEELDRSDAASESYAQAAWSATSAGDRRTAAMAWIALVYVDGYQRHDFAAAERAMRHADAEIDALGGDDVLAARRWGTIATSRFAEGRLDEARSAAARAVELHDRGDSELDTAGALMNLANFDLVLARLDDAEREIARVDAIWRGRVPDSHPVFARIAEARSRLADDRGEHSTALAEARRAHEIRLAVYGDGHADTLASATVLVEMLLASGDIDGALVLARRAHELGREHARIDTRISTALALARVLMAAGRSAEAEPVLAAGIGDAETLGDDAPHLVDLLELRGEARYQLARYADALSDYQRVLAIERGVWGPTHPYVALTEVDLATLERLLGHAELAAQHRHAAAQVVDASGDAEPLLRASMLVELAIECDLGGDHDTARALVDRARRTIDQGALHDSEPAQALAQHRFVGSGTAVVAPRRRP